MRRWVFIIDLQEGFKINYFKFKKLKNDELFFFTIKYPNELLRRNRAITKILKVEVKLQKHIQARIITKEELVNE